ncbi:hypothetical protein FRC01_003436, partial [Tulasnella sp. 417]
STATSYGPQRANPHPDKASSHNSPRRQELGKKLAGLRGDGRAAESPEGKVNNNAEEFRSRREAAQQRQQDPSVPLQPPKEAWRTSGRIRRSPILPFLNGKRKSD